MRRAQRVGEARHLPPRYHTHGGRGHAAAHVGWRQAHIAARPGKIARLERDLGLDEKRSVLPE